MVSEVNADLLSFMLCDSHARESIAIGSLLLLGHNILTIHNINLGSTT